MIRKVILILPFLFVAFSSNSQAIKKYSIDKTGCSLYMFCDPGKFDISYSDDSSRVYTGECQNENFIYGIICVQLKEVVSAKDDGENLLEAYLNFLKQQFSIKETTGYGSGMHLKDREDIIGMIDYWQSEDKMQWAIQGWTDGNVLAVLYVKGNTQPDYAKQQVFFKGLRFPGMQ